MSRVRHFLSKLLEYLVVASTIGGAVGFGIAIFPAMLSVPIVFLGSWLPIEVHKFTETAVVFFAGIGLPIAGISLALMCGCFFVGLAGSLLFDFLEKDGTSSSSTFSRPTPITQPQPKPIPPPQPVYGPDSGFVYIMANSSMPGVVKIGKTNRDPRSRAKELSSATGVPTPFVLMYSKRFSNHHKAEKVIHQYLEKSGKRVSPNREFFNATVEHATTVVNLAKTQLDPNDTENV